MGDKDPPDIGLPPPVGDVPTAQHPPPSMAALYTNTQLEGVDFEVNHANKDHGFVESNDQPPEGSTLDHFSTEKMQASALVHSDGKAVPGPQSAIPEIMDDEQGSGIKRKSSTSGDRDHQKRRQITATQGIRGSAVLAYPQAVPGVSLHAPMPTMSAQNHPVAPLASTPASQQPTSSTIATATQSPLALAQADPDRLRAIRYERLPMDLKRQILEYLSFKDQVFAAEAAFNFSGRTNTLATMLDINTEKLFGKEWRPLSIVIFECKAFSAKDRHYCQGRDRQPVERQAVATNTHARLAGRDFPSAKSLAKLGHIIANHARVPYKKYIEAVETNANFSDNVKRINVNAIEYLRSKDDAPEWEASGRPKAVLEVLLDFVGERQTNNYRGMCCECGGEQTKSRATGDEWKTLEKGRLHRVNPLEAGFCSGCFEAECEARLISIDRLQRYDMDVSLLKPTYTYHPSVNFQIEFFIKVSHSGDQYSGYRYFISRSDADLLARMYFNRTFEALETSTIDGTFPDAQRTRMAQNYRLARGVVENYRHLLLDTSRRPWPENAPVDAIRALGMDADFTSCLLVAMSATNAQSYLDDQKWWVSAIEAEVTTLQTHPQTQAVDKQRDYIAAQGLLYWRKVLYHRFGRVSLRALASRCIVRVPQLEKWLPNRDHVLDEISYPKEIAERLGRRIHQPRYHPVVAGQRQRVENLSSYLGKCGVLAMALDYYEQSAVRACIDLIFLSSSILPRTEKLPTFEHFLDLALSDEHLLGHLRIAHDNHPFRAVSEVPKSELAAHAGAFWNKLYTHPALLRDLEFWAQNKRVYIKLAPAAFNHTSHIPSFLKAVYGLDLVEADPLVFPNTHVFGTIFWEDIETDLMSST